MADQKLRVILEAKADKLIKALDKSSNKLKQFGKDATRIGKKLSIGLTLPIAAAGGAAIKLASDFEESLNKVDVSFKNSSKSVKEFSKTTLTQFGIAQGTALDMAAMFGDMGTSMGLTTQQAAAMSTSMVGLAGDLASFKNIQIEEATTALAAVFTGETESLKRLGIVMTEANLKQFALTQGITKNIKQMTQAEKTTLRYQYVIASTGNAQGDFARTQDGAANQMRIFTESLKQIGAELGGILLPTFTKVVTKVNNALASFMAFDDRTKKIIVTVAGLLAAVGPLLIGLGALPKILTAVSAGVKVIKIGMLALTSPIGLVVAALTAVALIIYKNWDKIEPVLVNIYNQFVDLYNSSETLRGVIGGLKGAFKAVFTAIKGYIDIVLNVFKSVGKVIKAVISGDFKEIGGIIKDAVVSTKNKYIDTGKEIASNVTDGIKNGIDSTLEKKTVGSITEQLQSAVNTAATNITVPTMGGGETRKPIAAVSGLGATAGFSAFTKQEVNQDPSSSLLGEMQTVDTDPVAMLAASVARSTEGLKGELEKANNVLRAKGVEQQIIAQEQAQAIGEIVGGGIANLAVGIGEALGNAIATSGKLGPALAGLLLNTMGDMAIRLGVLAITTGKAIEAIKASLKAFAGSIGIAAGIALIAIGTAAKAGAANIGKNPTGGGSTSSGPRSGAIAAFANGGIVSGPTLGLMGEYAGARSNPEVIAPLDKLKNIIGDRQAQQVNVGGEFRLQGQDLVVALQRAEKQRGRIK